MKHQIVCLAFAVLLFAAPVFGASSPSLFGFGQRKKHVQHPVQVQTPMISIRQESAKIEPPKQEVLKPVPTFDPTKVIGPMPQPAPKLGDAPKQQQAPKQQEPKREAPKVEAPKKKEEQQKYATCAEATVAVPGYTVVNDALKQCPDLMALQHDSSVAKTFFVPSDKAVEALAEYSHIPVSMLTSSKIKGMLCNMLKYHVVDGVHLKKTWTVGQKLPTMYNNAELTVSGVGNNAAVTTTTGVKANVKRVVFCGNSVVFGIDAVLTPFKVPRLGLGH